MWTAATHLLIYTKNTQKSIENMNFELRSSILPQVQSLLKSTFSTYNILPKLKNIFSITFKILKMTVYINELAKACFFFFSHPEGKENRAHGFSVCFVKSLDDFGLSIESENLQLKFRTLNINLSTWQSFQENSVIRHKHLFSAASSFVQDFPK